MKRSSDLCVCGHSRSHHATSGACYSAECMDDPRGCVKFALPPDRLPQQFVDVPMFDIEGTL